MALNRHEVGTVLLHTRATSSIELAVGGGMGCPEGAPPETRNAEAR